SALLSSYKFSEIRVKSFDFLNKNVDSKCTYLRRWVVSNESICINKEFTYKALIGLTAGFTCDSLRDYGIEVWVVYVVGGWNMMKDVFVDVTRECRSCLLDSTLIVMIWVF
ncbi:hypothetical protein H5410_051476, partial [Solanum commersonii]